MLMVQTYHSIHEIDTEFVANLEVLLKTEVASFAQLVRSHDTAPEGDLFTYFLFFGPTQNTPVGIAQLTLRPVPWQNYLPWWRRWLFFWRRDHLHWKEAIWKVGDGSAGLAVFEPRFARPGKKKILEIIADYEQRPEIKASLLYEPQGVQEAPPLRAQDKRGTDKVFFLEPLARGPATYQEYLASLSPTVQAQIKEQWKALHKSGEVKLGDYASPAELKLPLPISVRDEAQVLTFEQDDRLLGCVLVEHGKDGNVFFEAQPFEPEEGSRVSDLLYTQYALLKFFELPAAQRCHLLRRGEKFHFESEEELGFFHEQGFGARTIERSFYSRLKGLDHPL
jgi:hypothetical protein